MSLVIDGEKVCRPGRTARGSPEAQRPEHGREIDQVRSPGRERLGLSETNSE